MRNDMREADVNRKALLQLIADFVQKVLPRTTTATASRTRPAFSDKSTSPLKHTDTPPPQSRDPDSHEIVYETPSSRETVVMEEEDDDVGDDGDHAERTRLW